MNGLMDKNFELASVGLFNSDMYDVMYPDKFKTYLISTCIHHKNVPRL